MDSPPPALRLSISVYSIAEKGEVDCPTVLELNGTQILDFREVPGGGSWKTVTTDISVDPNRLEAGVNEITIRERQCVGINAWNDSVITLVGLEAH